MDLAVTPSLLPGNEPAASQQPPSVASLVLVRGGGAVWSRDARLLSGRTDLPSIHLLGGLGLKDSERCPLYCGPCM